MHLSYLQYQLCFHGIRKVRMRNAGNCRFTSWRMYDPQARLEPETLYLMTARQFQSLNQPVTAVCIPDYPADGDLPPQNGLYINSCLSSPAFYNLIQELYSEYERWNFALSFAEGMELSRLLELSTPILHMPLTIIDSQFHFVAKNSLYSQKFSGDGLELADLEEIIWTEDFKKCMDQKDVFHFYLQNEQKTLLCYHLFRDGQFFARILGSIEEESYRDPQEILFSRMAVALKTMIESEPSSRGLHMKSREFQATVRCLLEGNRDVDPQVLLQHQWSLEDTYALSVIRCYDRFPLEEAEKYFSSSLQSLFPHSCVLRLDQDFVCVWNLALISGEDYVFQEKMAVFLREHVAKAGDSNSFCGREDFSLYLNQAREALRLGDKYAPHFWHYRFEDYAYIYLLEHCAAPFGPLQVCSPALRILQNYDTEKDGDLYRTLQVHLRTGCNVTQSAELLNIHRTSMMKRLNRIKKLTGIRLENADTRLYLMLSYKILELSGSGIFT